MEGKNEKKQNCGEEILNHQEKGQLEGGSESAALPNEKLDFSEMEETEGGAGALKEEDKKDEGSGGGLICWC